MIADAGQDVQPLDVVKSKADTELGQIAPMGLTFYARSMSHLLGLDLPRKFLLPAYLGGKQDQVPSLGTTVHQ